MNIKEADRQLTTKSGNIAMLEDLYPTHIWRVYKPNTVKENSEYGKVFATNEASNLYNKNAAINILMLYPDGENKNNYDGCLQNFLNNN
jgi:hypothetical protein